MCREYFEYELDLEEVFRYYTLKGDTMKFLDKNMNYESFINEIETSMKGDFNLYVLYKRKCYDIKLYRDFSLSYKVVLVDEVNDLEESWYTDDLFSFFKKAFLHILKW